MFQNVFFCSGVLGAGQETGAEEAFPLRQLAAVLLQLHPRLG